MGGRSESLEVGERQGRGFLPVSLLQAVACLLPGSSCHLASTQEAMTPAW